MEKEETEKMKEADLKEVVAVEEKGASKAKAKAPAEETEKAKEPAEAKEKKEEVIAIEKPQEEKAGIAYIYSTSNNTFVHITDLAGNTISRVSGGMVTKSDRLKSNPTIAMFVAKKAAERARDLGINSLYIRTRGRTREPTLGPGGYAAVKSLGKGGFRILSILDTTKIPRGGPKKKGGKRGRRV